MKDYLYLPFNKKQLLELLEGCSSYHYDTIAGIYDMERDASYYDDIAGNLWLCDTRQDTINAIKSNKYSYYLVEFEF